MKFKRELQETLIKEGFPAEWVDSAIPYGPLKKIIKKVRKELEDLGVNPEELAGDLEYGFEDGDEDFKPKLILYYDSGDEAPVDATLSIGTKEHFKDLVARRKIRKGQSDLLDKRRESTRSDDPEDECTISGVYMDDSEDHTQEAGVPISRRSMEDLDHHNRRPFPVPLTFDSQFFSLLLEDVYALDKLQADQQKALTEEITALSKNMAHLTSPSKFTKTDMYRWRELFDLYLQAQIFFSTREQDRGIRDSAAAKQQLVWFQTEATKRGFHDGFRLPASLQAFSQFLTINGKLLMNLRFQEVNQQALGKILKKFDKRTQLGAKNLFPMRIQSGPMMSNTMAKAVCARVTEDIVGITPQIDDGDYTCPICSTIAWRPIRLACQHVLCSKCTVHLQATFKYNCPICRTKRVVKEANEDNIDEELIRKLKKYFPKETKEKRIQLETEDGIATFGPKYKHPSQEKCEVM